MTQTMEVSLPTGISHTVTSRMPNGRVLCVPREYRSIHSAIMSAVDGDCIALSSGIYELREPICVDRNIHIIASDEGSSPVVVRLDTTKSKLLRSSTHMISIDCTACRISNITFEHTTETDPESEHLVFAVWCKRGTPILDQCTLYSNIGSAIGVNEKSFPTIRRCQLRGVDYAAFIGNLGKLRLDKCFITGNKGCYCEELATCEIDSCHISDCVVGIELQSSCKAIVQNNKISSCSEAGIYCLGGVNLDTETAIDISTNYFEVNNNIGIVVDSGKPTVRKNTFTAIQQTAIDIRCNSRGKYINNTFNKSIIAVLVSTKSNPSFLHNSFTDCQKAIVVKDKFSQGTFTNNKVLDCESSVMVLNEAGPQFISNTISGSPIGISFSEKSKGCVRGNTISFCKTGLFTDEGSNPTVDKNCFESCGSGIVVKNSSGKIIRNIISNTEESAIKLDSSKGTFIESNVISDSGKEGFLIIHASEATLVTNTVRGSKVSPLQCTEDCQTTIELQDNNLQKGIFSSSKDL